MTLDFTFRLCHVIAKKIDHIDTIEVWIVLCLRSILSGSISKKRVCDCSAFLNIQIISAIRRITNFTSNIPLVSPFVSHCFAVISFQIWSPLTKTRCIYTYIYIYRVVRSIEKLRGFFYQTLRETKIEMEDEMQCNANNLLKQKNTGFLYHNSTWAGGNNIQKIEVHFLWDF